MEMTVRSPSAIPKNSSNTMMTRLRRVVKMELRLWMMETRMEMIRMVNSKIRSKWSRM
jgi:hypothetical protein